MVLALSITAYGNRPVSNAGIEISASVENDLLKIEVAEELSDATVTVSVFSEIGEIVLEKTLNLGVNNVDVEDLEKGEYVAVVRENGEYMSKSSFSVN